MCLDKEGGIQTMRFKCLLKVLLEAEPLNHPSNFPKGINVMFVKPEPDIQVVILTTDIKNLAYKSKFSRKFTVVFAYYFAELWGGIICLKVSQK